MEPPKKVNHQPIQDNFDQKQESIQLHQDLKTTQKTNVQQTSFKKEYSSSTLIQGKIKSLPASTQIGINAGVVFSKMVAGVKRFLSNVGSDGTRFINSIRGLVQRFTEHISRNKEIGAINERKNELYLKKENLEIASKSLREERKGIRNLAGIGASQIEERLQEIEKTLKENTAEEATLTKEIGECETKINVLKSPKHPESEKSVTMELAQRVHVKDKEHLSITDSKMSDNREKISKIDVSGFESSSARFAKKAIRFINLFTLVGGAFNAHTIMAGASKSWDPERLKTGKHALLAKIGAEHIQLQSRTGCKVDAHFLSAASFANCLENLGGIRSIFQLDVKDASIFSGKKCLCMIEDGFPIEMQEIELNEEQQEKNKFGRFIIDERISLVTGIEQRVVQDEKSGKFYLLDSLATSKLSNAGMLNFKNKLVGVNIQETSQISSLLSKEMEFPGFKFEKSSSEWKEAKALLEDMKINKSSWGIVETEENGYLVPCQHMGKIKWAASKNDEVSLVERHSSTFTESSERGTVLLTVNQSDIYEQYPHEMLTLLLMGINVMGYNNPSKGLSTGSADRENINASIEASYQYLKSKNIPDEKILAKGQCFGGAPTAWLGRKHPKINLMLDQNPANFHDVAMKKVNATAEDLIKQDNAFFIWVGRMLKDNFIINGIARAVLSGYDVPGDLSYNEGHKLFNINVPNAQGIGGDQLVPKEHPELMINAISNNKGIVTLSMNPGASHVTDWWAGNESRDVVTSFLKAAKISHPLF